MSAAEMMARRFHEAYERLAPSFGYATRPETRHFDPKSANGQLMIAVCEEFVADPCRSGWAGMSKHVTTSSAHGFQEGDIIAITSEHKAYTLWQLLKRPRVRYVASVTSTGLEMQERRMNWAEWRAAWLFFFLR